MWGQTEAWDIRGGNSQAATDVVRCQWVSGGSGGHLVKSSSGSFSFLSEVESQGTSLVVQWLRNHLPMQGTRVRGLVREDSTCRGATKPVCHNY